MFTAAKETSPVSIGNDVRYTGSFLFHCLPFFAAKKRTPAIEAPYLWLKRPPVQKPLIGDFGGSVYHIKKEFDQEGEINGVGGINAYYFGARYYDPVIGVWFSTDPDNQFVNSYSYGPANPINGIDERGRFWIVEHHVHSKGALSGGVSEGPVRVYYTLQDHTPAEYILKGQATGQGVGFLLSKIPVIGTAASLLYSAIMAGKGGADIAKHPEMLFDGWALPEDMEFESPQKALDYARKVEARAKESGEFGGKLVHWGDKKVRDPDVIDPEW